MKCQCGTEIDFTLVSTSGTLYCKNKGCRFNREGFDTFTAFNYILARAEKAEAELVKAKDREAYLMDDLSVTKQYKEKAEAELKRAQDKDFVVVAVCEGLDNKLKTAEAELVKLTKMNKNQKDLIYRWIAEKEAVEAELASLKKVLSVTNDSWKKLKEDNARVKGITEEQIENCFCYDDESNGEIYMDDTLKAIKSLIMGV